MRTTRRKGTRWTVLGTAVSCAVSLCVPAANPATAAQPATPAPRAVAPGPVGPAGSPQASAPAGAPTSTITLVTGDVVRLSGEPGHQSAEVVTDVAPVGDVSIMVIGNDMYALPGAAVPMIAAGQLDLSMFNLSLLARDGYTDDKTPQLPMIVSYKSDAAAVQADREHRLAGATTGKHLSSVRGLATRVDRKQAKKFFDSIAAPATSTAPGSSTQAGAAKPLTVNPELAKVWLDTKVRASLDSSRTSIGADKAWAAGFDGTGVTVGVLDTGIDQNHPDLVGKVTDKKNFVPAGLPGGGDPADVTDRYGHGTHVAGTIAGTGAASAGEYAGVASKAKLVIGKVLGDNGAGYDSDIIAGMEWAASKAKVINMSLGGQQSDGTDPLSQALNDISRRTGALFVVAAGNMGGNGIGTAPNSIGTPAAADMALAVGAVHHHPGDAGFTASFSSIGPRGSDLAIKPEIAAPGAAVTAPRAAGTTMGTPLSGEYGKWYTGADGTSMATPHVAGSAAILLQRHPGWTAQQIRDALTSTATPPPPPPATCGVCATPIYWQGAGTVNVGRAVTQDLTATGILNLGIATFPQQPGTVFTGDVTYTNNGPRPVTLRLDAVFRQAPDDFAGSAETAWTPPAGAISMPTEVTVPAGASQTVKVSIDMTKAPFGTTFGRLQAASADGATVARTTLGFTREIETRQLTMRANDRDGRPVNTVAHSYGVLLDLSTGHALLVTFQNGDGKVWGKSGNRLPIGRRYAFEGYLGGFGKPPIEPLTSWTSVAEPEIVMDHDHTYVFDARTAGRIDVHTPRTTSLSTSDTWMERTVMSGTRQVAHLAFQPGLYSGATVSSFAPAAYTLKGGQATTGTFRHLHYVHRQQPPIVLRVSGDGAEFQPWYPTAGVATIGTSDLDTARQPRFPATTNLSLADVGTGSADEIAAAKVAGKLALLRPPAAAVNGKALMIDDTARRIADAGAAGIVVAPPVEGAITVYAGAPTRIPTAVLSDAEAPRLTALVAEGHARAKVAGVWPSPYTYDLVFTENQSLNNGAAYDIKERDLARVTARYHSVAPDAYYSVYRGAAIYFGSGARMTGFGEVIPAPTVRTELFSATVPFHQFRSQRSGTLIEKAVSAENVWARALPAGTNEMNVGSGPWVPGPCDVVTPGCAPPGMLAFTFGPLLYALAGARGPGSGNLVNIQSNRMWDVNKTTVICEPPACQTDRSGNNKVSDGVYRVVTDQAGLGGGPSCATGCARFPLSTRSHTEWTINVHLGTPGISQAQPAILTEWYVDAGLDNVVPAERAYRVRVAPSYGAHTQTHGPLTARLWATYDDGQSWTQIPGDQEVQAGEAAEFSLRTPKQTNGFVGYRAVISDRDGNTVDQSVFRAAYTRVP